jgi:DNA polymerase-3 subunit gamma/tau
MAYEVLARKWRPQQFDEVVGQQHVTQTLKNAIEADRVAHAYLFVGPRGIGKTTSARILAKALNCEKGPTPTPCDKCSSCTEIMAGNSLDVIEIDGASNRGIDHIRDLRENVAYAPARGPYKIYIIDEVHMLTTESFNALLKTLEEPPRHVKFLFATTEPQKVPATILSRCQRFDLRPIATRDIVGHLGTIAKAEGIDISEDALLAIGRGAEGGLRDAESALDQLVTFCGKTIGESDVMSVFGLTSRESLEGLVGAILEGRVPDLLQQVARMETEGKDVQRLVVELIGYFRNLLVLQYDAVSADALDTTEAQLESLKKQAGNTDAERVLRIIGVLTKADQDMRYALSRRTLLEVSLIRAARAATVVSVDQVIKKLAALREQVVPGSTGSVESSGSVGGPKKKDLT